MIKNIITSGCVVYPIKHLCIENLPWTNIQQIQNSQIEGQAWSKAWPDRSNKEISMKEFNKNFNWLNAWKQKHLKYIINIIIPYILILFIIIVFLKFNSTHTKTSNNRDINRDEKKRIWLALLTSLIGTFSFFLIFPIYRYGYSYIIALITLIFIITIKNSTKVNRYIYLSKFILILSICAFLGKQSQKIIVNIENSLWPNIYTFDPNVKKKIYTKQKIQHEDNFYYYLADRGDRLCMYSKSPCTSYFINKNVKHIKKLNYSIFTIK